ncbi:MAG: hypothetical protein MSIBF_07310 [Candidatus Altiarchaeales archaeon IMC4]|nr:MAG: hypothetical protein MSIBF_07310 [Candidatus Altiarchaeales archaeon IMC4]
MYMEKILHRYNLWWGGEVEFTYNPREIFPEIWNTISDNKITVLTGLRRVGKTTLMKMVIAALIKQKTDPTRILYVSLDNIAFLDIGISDIVEEFRKINRIPFKEKVYLFLDEAGYKKDYEIELKNLFDMGNVKIFVSSSSTSILKSKVPYITGRTKTINVLPLNFKEFLDFREIKIKSEDAGLYKSYFEDYLKIGGLPEYVLTEDAGILTELIEQVIYKDVIAFHQIKEGKTVLELFRLLCERVGKPFTYNKLSKVLGTSPESIKRYITYFEDAYLFYTIERYARSLNERVYSPKKVYVGDVGLRNVTVGFKDKGSLYENLVFLKIKDKKPGYYYKAGVELDFVFEDTLLECKYGGELTKKQEELLNKSKMKKIIARGCEFFMD